MRNNVISKLLRRVGIGRIISFLLLVAAVLMLCVTSRNRALQTFSASSASVHTLVIDAGHGGEDGGAVSDNGTVESGLNLDIALRLEAFMRFMGEAPMMTRTEDALNYSENEKTMRSKKVTDQKYRVALINSVENPLLISIHMNKYPSDNAVCGIQTFYGKNENGRIFAEMLQGLLTESLKPEKARSAARISSDVYLMKNISCPAVLVECGFLSNPSEETKLLTDEYRLKIAVTLAAGYINYEYGGN